MDLPTLKHNFDLYDQDRNGYVTIDELAQIYAKFGLKTERSTLEYLMMKYDKNGDGGINFQEFCDLIGGGHNSGQPQVRGGPSTSGYNLQTASPATYSQNPSTYNAGQKFVTNPTTYSQQPSTYTTTPSQNFGTNSTYSRPLPSNYAQGNSSGIVNPPGPAIQHSNVPAQNQGLAQSGPGVLSQINVGAIFGGGATSPGPMSPGQNPFSVLGRQGPEQGSTGDNPFNILGRQPQATDGKNTPGFGNQFTFDQFQHMQVADHHVGPYSNDKQNPRISNPAQSQFSVGPQATPPNVSVVSGPGTSSYQGTPQSANKQFFNSMANPANSQFSSTPQPPQGVPPQGSTQWNQGNSLAQQQTQPSPENYGNSQQQFKPLRTAQSLVEPQQQYSLPAQGQYSQSVMGAGPGNRAYTFDSMVDSNSKKF